MPDTLDRKRPFGEIHGEWPWKYEQDGKKFSADGQRYYTPEEQAATVPPPSGGPTAGYAAMETPELRAAYRQRTQRDFKVGTSRDKMVEILEGLDLVDDAGT